MKHRIDDMDKKIDFKVPDGYFENLPLKIQQRIEIEKKEAKTFTLPTWSYALAASALLIMGFVILFQNPSPSAEKLLAEVSEEALIAYLDDIEIDEYDLVSALPDHAEDLPFNEIDMLQNLDLGDESMDDILLEFNIEEETLEI